MWTEYTFTIILVLNVAIMSPNLQFLADRIAVCPQVCCECITPWQGVNSKTDFLAWCKKISRVQWTSLSEISGGSLWITYTNCHLLLLWSVIAFHAAVDHRTYLNVGFMFNEEFAHQQKCWNTMCKISDLCPSKVWEIALPCELLRLLHEKEILRYWFSVYQL